MDMSNLVRRSLRCYLSALLCRTTRSLPLFASSFKYLGPRGVLSIELLESLQFRSQFSSSESLCLATGKLGQTLLPFDDGISCKTSSSVSSSRAFSRFDPSHDFSRSSHLSGWRKRSSSVGLFTRSSHGAIRCFSVSPLVGSRPRNKLTSGHLGPGIMAKHVLQVIEFIKNGETDFESELNEMDERLSVSSLIEILLILNSSKMSAFPFFDWVRCSHPELYWNSEVCSLLVDNCGRLGEFEAMRCLLNGFSEKSVMLTGKAFWFLPVMSSSESSQSKAVEEVVVLLNGIGGSCLASGIPALIDMYSTLGSYEMAKRILRYTQRKTSHYNLLIKKMCGRGDFDGPQDLLDEMKKMGCDPNVQTYNYIISLLCKKNMIAEACRLTQEMQERGCNPNALTYEIFICCLCRHGKLDLALKLLDKIPLRGLEPRLATHGAIMKAYFNSRQYGVAHKYVVLSSDKYKCSSNMMYSLLASLHQKTGNLASAQEILSQMMGKGLRPFLRVYRQVLRHLNGSGRKDMAERLESCFRNLNMQLNTHDR